MKNKLINTILFSVIFFLIVLVLSGNIFTQCLNLKKIETIHIFIAIIPFVIWLIATGKLKEIKGPGDIGLTIQDATQKTIDIDLSSEEIDYEKHSTDEKRSDYELDLLFKSNKPITTLSFELGKIDYYEESVIYRYINKLRKRPEFKFVLFFDKNKRFKGLMELPFFDSLFRNGDIAKAIENSSILNENGIIKSFVYNHSTNKETLKVMDDNKLSFIPVLNSSEQFIGVVKIDDLMRKILKEILIKS